MASREADCFGPSSHRNGALREYGSRQAIGGRAGWAFCLWAVELSMRARQTRRRYARGSFWAGQLKARSIHT